MRYRILDYWGEGGYYAVVQTRREHVDPPGHWAEAFKTETYGTSRGAAKRARLWVRHNLPGAFA